MIKNTYRIMDIADRNNVARGVANLAKVLPEDIFPIRIKMQPIKVTEAEAGETKTIFRPSQFKPKGNIIEYFDGGKRKYLEVNSNLYQAMTGLNETSVSLFTKIMSQPAQWLRTGATITPEFMLRNPIKDQFTALMQTKFGFKPFIDSGGAVAEIMGKSDVYYDWLRSGGAYSSFVELSRDNVKKVLNDLKGRPNLIKRLNIIARAQDISQLLEQATRLGTYKAATKSGLSPIEAGFESREATVDFARRGAKTKDINSVIAFFNAGIQGTDKSIRAAINDPAGFAAKGIATITIPSLLSYILNHDDEGYKELPRWQKDLFWIFKVGETYIRMPKPFVYGQVFGSIPERFLEYLDTQDPSAFDKLSKSLYESISPVSGEPISGLLPTTIKPLIENATNWNFFLQRSIVPEGKKRLLPEEQYQKNTSETAKILGKELKYSPAKLENIVGGYFGGTGRYALETGDLAIKRIKKVTGQPITPERPIELSDLPLIRGFVTRSPYSGSAESIQRFFDNRKRISELSNTFKLYLKNREATSARKILKENPEIRFAPALDKYADVIAEYERKIEKVSKSATYTVKQKKELINYLERKTVETAKKANALLSKKKSLVIPGLFDEEKKPGSRVIPNLFD